jgi:hypothetical protein
VTAIRSAGGRPLGNGSWSDGVQLPGVVMMCSCLPGRCGRRSLLIQTLAHVRGSPAAAPQLCRPGLFKGAKCGGDALDGHPGGSLDLAYDGRPGAPFAGNPREHEISASGRVA